MAFPTDWIIFQSKNTFNHKLACKKCPLCQVLLLNDLELEWSQALRGLEGSASPAAHLQGEFLEQHSLAFQLAPASITPAEDNTLLGITAIAPSTKPTFFRITFNPTLSTYLIAQKYLFSGICTSNTAVSASWFLLLEEGECLQNLCH